MSLFLFKSNLSISKKVKTDTLFYNDSRDKKKLFSYGFHYQTVFLENLLSQKKQNVVDKTVSKTLSRNYEENGIKLHYNFGTEKLQVIEMILLLNEKHILKPNNINIQSEWNGEEKSDSDDVFAFLKFGITNKKKTNMFFSEKRNLLETFFYYVNNIDSGFKNTEYLLLKTNGNLFEFRDIKTLFLFSHFFSEIYLFIPSFIEMKQKNNLFILLKNKKNKEKIKLPKYSDMISDVFTDIHISTDFKSFILNYNIQNQILYLEYIIASINIIDENRFFGEKYEEFIFKQKHHSKEFMKYIKEEKEKKYEGGCLFPVMRN